MTTQEKIASTAPCGLDCFNCAAHEANITPEYRARAAKLFGVAPEDTGCRGGCRAVKGRCLWANGSCATYACAERRGSTIVHPIRSSRRRGKNPAPKTPKSKHLCPGGCFAEGDSLGGAKAGRRKKGPIPQSTYQLSVNFVMWREPVTLTVVCCCKYM